MVDTALALKEHLKRYGIPTPKIVICDPLFLCCSPPATPHHFALQACSQITAWGDQCMHAHATAHAHLVSLGQCKDPEAGYTFVCLEPPTQCSESLVWHAGAHNSHRPDATDMGIRRGEVNVGQLMREHVGDRHPSLVANLGFTTHTGTVAAADDWNEPVRNKRVKPSLPGKQSEMQMALTCCVIRAGLVMCKHSSDPHLGFPVPNVSCMDSHDVLPAELLHAQRPTRVSCPASRDQLLTCR